MSATKAISEWESVEVYLPAQGTWVLVGSTKNHDIQYADGNAAAGYINHLRRCLDSAYQKLKEYEHAKDNSDNNAVTTGGASDCSTD